MKSIFKSVIATCIIIIALAGKVSAATLDHSDGEPKKNNTTEQKSNSSVVPLTIEESITAEFNYLRFDVNQYTEGIDQEIGELPSDKLLETLRFDVNYYIQQDMNRNMELPEENSVN